MILVCGATGDLGGRIARLLVSGDHEVRALVRPATDAGALRAAGVEVIRGDLREPGSLGPAVQGVDTVITTANAIGRMLAGRTDLTMTAVDRDGTLNLLRAAEAAGVRRFLFVSAAGISDELARLAPLAAAKLAVERALARTSLQVVVLRPDMFDEVWLAPASGIDPAAGSALIYGRWTLPHPYIAIDDVAALAVHLALAAQPPAMVEVGGPESLSRLQAVSAFEAATGRRLAVRHVPRPVLALGCRVLARLKPEVASLMGMALYFDCHPSTWDDRPLREAGIEPRPASAYIREAVGAGAQA